MPQWRKLHTKTLDSLDVNDMPDDFTRLLWVLLPLVLDRCGRGIDNMAWLRSKVFPLREDVTVAMVDSGMAWYTARGMIERYTVEDRAFFVIPTWHQHQGKTLRETESNIPARVMQELVVSDTRVSRELVTQDAGVSQELVRTNSRTEEKRVEEKRIEEKRVDVLHPRPNAFGLYEQGAGLLSPLVSEKLGKMIDEYERHRLTLGDGVPGSDIDGDAWVSNAILVARDAGVQRLSPNYIDSILTRWRAEGYKAKPHWKKNPRGRTAPSTEPAPVLITELEPVA